MLICPNGGIHGQREVGNPFDRQCCCDVIVFPAYVIMSQP